MIKKGHSVDGQTDGDFQKIFCWENPIKNFSTQKTLEPAINLLYDSNCHIYLFLLLIKNWKEEKLYHFVGGFGTCNKQEQQALLQKQYILKETFRIDGKAWKPPRC